MEQKRHFENGLAYISIPFKLRKNFENFFKKFEKN